MKKSLDSSSIFVLFIIALGAGIFFFYSQILKPMIDEKIPSLQSEVQMGEQNVNNMFEVTMTYDEKRTALTEKLETVHELANNFYEKEIMQENYIDFVDELFASCGLELSSYGYGRETGYSGGSYETYSADSLYTDGSYTDGSYTDGSYSEPQYDEYGNPIETQSSTPVVKTTQFNISATGPWTGIETLLATIAANEKFIVSDSISLSTNESADGTNVYTISMSLYFNKIEYIASESLDESTLVGSTAFQLPIEYSSGSYKNLWNIDNIMKALGLG
jgi:hypothetical protein